MTDEKTTEEAPSNVSVWVCRNPTHEDRQCFALVENTRDARIAHRAWHQQQHTDREALRGAIKERDEAIAGYRAEVAEFRRIVAGYEETVAGLHGEVQRVETPVAPPALEISHETYDDEQPEPEPEDDWHLPRAAAAPTVEDAVAGEPAESAADELPVDTDLDDDDRFVAPTPADVMAAHPSWTR
jgi:hypothetical protein